MNQTDEDITHTIYFKQSIMTPIMGNQLITNTFQIFSQSSVNSSVLFLITTSLTPTFFFLPYTAKQIGLINTILLLFVSFIISYYASKVLYFTYEVTKGRTYDECFRILFGKKMGLFVNIIILLDLTIGLSVLVIYSFMLISDGIYVLFTELISDKVKEVVTICYFIFTFILLLIASSSRNINRLKYFALAGLLFLFYLFLCFSIQTKEYYDYYRKAGRFEFHSFLYSPFILQGFGFTQAIFLNQYCVIPLYSNLSLANENRIEKILTRGNFVLFLIYVLFLLVGYFSEPNDTTQELFILRKKLDYVNDFFIIIGKVGFGLTLFVTALVRHFFLVIYVDQFFKNIRQQFRSVQISKKKREHLEKIEKVEAQQTQQKKESSCEIDLNLIKQLSKKVAFWRKVKFISKRSIVTLIIILIAQYFQLQIARAASQAGNILGCLEMIILPNILLIKLKTLKKENFNFFDELVIMLTITFTFVSIYGVYVAFYTQ